MKKLSVTLASIVLLAGAALAGPQNPCNPCGKKAQNPCNPCAGKSGKVEGGKRTVTGYIGDSMCGLEHPMNMGDATECTLKCVEGGGKFILADRENKVVYSIGAADQEKVREYAGQKVKVSGTVNAKTKTIKITKVEAAS